LSRIGSLNVAQLTPEMRAVCERHRERHGAPLENHLILARCPEIFWSFRGMWEGLERSALLPSRLRDLVNLKVAALVGCSL
jgi:hypothetical protein